MVLMEILIIIGVIALVSGMLDAKSLGKIRMEQCDGSGQEHFNLYLEVIEL